MKHWLRSSLAAIILFCGIVPRGVSAADVDSCVGRDLGDVVVDAANADAAAVDRTNLALTKILKRPPMTPTPWRFRSAAEVSAFYDPILATLKGCAAQAPARSTMLIARYLSFAMASVYYGEALAHFHDYTRARENEDAAIRVAHIIGALPITGVKDNPVSGVVRDILHTANAVESSLP